MTADGWRDWEWMIRTCLEQIPNYCTLDLDVAQAEGLLESSLVEFDNFRSHDFGQTTLHPTVWIQCYS
jgi:hypothetical protein